MYVSDDKLILNCRQCDKTFVCDNNNSSSSDGGKVVVTSSQQPSNPAQEVSIDHRRWLLYTRLAMPHPAQVCQVDADLSMLVLEQKSNSAGGGGGSRVHVYGADGRHVDVALERHDVKRVRTVGWFHGKLYMAVESLIGKYKIIMFH